MMSGSGGGPPPPPYPTFPSPSSNASPNPHFRPHPMATPPHAIGGQSMHGGVGGPAGGPPGGAQTASGLAAPPMYSEAEEKQRIRFQIELEFVQCLGNPNYLHFLAQRGYFKDSCFVNYLKYLQYWKEPKYVHFIKYPVCLHFLELLQHEAFRKEIVNGQVRKNAEMPLSRRPIFSFFCFSAPNSWMIKRFFIGNIMPENASN